MRLETFNEVIMREVLRNTPLRAFRSQASRKLLSNNMSRYLCAHVQRTRVGKKLEDRRDGQPIKAQYFLMDYITKILDRIYLLSDNETISNKTRERHEAILCDGKYQRSPCCSNRQQGVPLALGLQFQVLYWVGNFVTT